MNLIIENNNWYACTFLGDEFSGEAIKRGSIAYSPIKVYEFLPLKTGRREFVLKFLHLNYPEGVRDKKYKLRKSSHGRTFLLACSLTHSPTRILYINPVSKDWLLHHWRSEQMPRELKRLVGI